MNKYIEESVFNYRQVLPYEKYVTDTGIYVAGGCFKNIFNGEKIKDIDIFFSDNKKFQEYLNDFKRKKEMTLVRETDNCVTFKNKDGIMFDIVRREFGSVEDLFKKFDFTIVKFALYKKEKKSDEKDFETTYETKVMYHDKFFEHLYLKRLVINEEEIYNPYNTFSRAYKYVKYGYMPCRETQEKIIKSIKEDTGEVDIGRSIYNGID